ncbi:MAG: 4Fe-4S binding protein [Clostridia bacterium]|nr:4Fe-4S binding protein [Clostridia bacterium]
MYVVTVDADLCTACGACVSACPGSVLELEDVCVVTDNECMGCESCIAICPVEAITISEY